MTPMRGANQRTADTAEKGVGKMNQTLHEAREAYLDHLKAQGKKDRTLYTYGRDFDQIEAFFGADRKLTATTLWNG